MPLLISSRMFDAEEVKRIKVQDRNHLDEQIANDIVNALKTRWAGHRLGTVLDLSQMRCLEASDSLALDTVDNYCLRAGIQLTFVAGCQAVSANLEVFDRPIYCNSQEAATRIFRTHYESRLGIWVTWHKQQQVACVELVGVVDGYSAPELRDSLSILLERGRHRIVIDVANLNMINSTGIELLRQMRKAARAKGGDVRLASYPSITLTPVALSKGFHTYTDVKRAIDLFLPVT